MAVDLVSLVSQVLTPQLIGQIAKAAGIDPAAAQKLVSGAIPAILAALGGAAASADGAQKVSDAISNADPDLLNNLKGALTGGQSQLLGDGAKALGGLLGGGALTSLANALGQQAGVSSSAAQIVIGAVSQTIVGVVGQQDPSNWTDGGSIAGLLGDQKRAIAAAMPAGLANALGASGVTGAAASAATSAASMAARTASAASSAMTSAPAAAARSSGFPTWAIVVIIVVVLAVVYWYMSQKPAEKPATGQGPATIELALAAAPAGEA